MRRKGLKSALGCVLSDIHLIDVGVLPSWDVWFPGLDWLHFLALEHLFGSGRKQNACRNKDETRFHWSGIYEVVEIKWGQSDGGLVASLAHLAAEEGQAFILQCVFKGLLGRVDQDQDVLVKIVSADDEHTFFRRFDLRCPVEQGHLAFSELCQFLDFLHQSLFQISVPIESHHLAVVGGHRRHGARIRLRSRPRGCRERQN